MKRIHLHLLTILLTMMGLSSCIHIFDIGLDRPHDFPDDHPESEVTFRQNPKWRLNDEGRYVQHEYGRDVYIDRFAVQSDDAIPYYMDLVSEEFLREEYQGDIKKLFLRQAENLYKDHQDGYIDLKKELMTGNNTIEYDRLASGRWFAYCFGMLSNGQLTGDYQILEVNVKVERASFEYMRWLGQWSIGNHEKRYRIHIQQDEPNYSYAITGWEGEEPYADEYVILTDFDRNNGNMLFYQQILGDFQAEETKEWYDIMFCGSFLYKEAGQVKDTLAVIGPSTIAEASLRSSAGQAADVTGMHSSVKLDRNEYRFTYSYMHLKDVPENEDLGMLSYDTHVPEFPLEMIRVEDKNLEQKAAETGKATSVQGEDIRLRQPAKASRRTGRASRMQVRKLH